MVGGGQRAGIHAGAAGIAPVEQGQADRQLEAALVGAFAVRIVEHGVVAQAQLDVHQAGQKLQALRAAGCIQLQPRQLGNLADLARGYGTADDPVSFDALSEHATRRAAAASFFQLLVLKSWDVIDIQQDKAYGDIMVARTVRGARAVEVPFFTELSSPGFDPEAAKKYLAEAKADATGETMKPGSVFQ